MRAHNDMAVAHPWPEHVDGGLLLRAADVLRQLADQTRMHLLWLLAAGPLDVSSLTARVDASRRDDRRHVRDAGYAEHEVHDIPHHVDGR